MSACIIAAVSNECWAHIMALYLKSWTQHNHLNNHQFKATAVGWATLWVRNELRDRLTKQLFGGLKMCEETSGSIFLSRLDKFVFLVKYIQQQKESLSCGIRYYFLCTWKQEVYMNNKYKRTNLFRTAQERGTKSILALRSTGNKQMQSVGKMQVGI